MPKQLPRLGKYENLEEIGSGGFATVYKARDSNLDRVVALKVLRTFHSSESKIERRFITEARQAANLRHNNIVRVLDVGEHQGQPYIAMDYLPGGNLAQRLSEGALPLETAVVILEQLASALDYAHARNLVHRDVKPANVLFDEDDNAVLCDFGLARSLLASGLTADGTRLCTPAYMSPEQAGLKTDLGPAADIYALGVVAYEMLAGRVPFEGGDNTTPLAVLNAHLSAPPPDPRALNPALNEDLAQALLGALHKSPAHRPPSAGAFARSLRAVLDQAQAADRRAVTLEALYPQAEAAVEAGEWGQAIALCGQILQIDSGYRKVGALFDQAKAGWDEQQVQIELERRLGGVYREGEQFLEQKHWSEAIRCFQDVVDQASDFENAAALLEQAKQAASMQALYETATQSLEKDRFDAACRDLLQLLNMAPAYQDAALRLRDASGGLLGEFEGVRSERDALAGKVKDLQGEINKIKRQAADLDQSRAATIKKLESERDALAGKAQDLERELDEARQLAAALDRASQALTNYDALLGAFEQKDWEKAIEFGERLAQLAPDLARPQAWLARARSQLERQVARGQDRMTWEREDGKEMLRIPAGEFLYGDKKEKVALPEFWIDQTPVTNAEYKRFLDANPKHQVPFVDKDWARPYNWDSQARTFPQDKGQHPVVLVSWHDAVAYAQWAGKRLPTEQEWEKAARGADGRAYPWGDDEPTPDLCNFGSNEGGTTPVGQYSPQFHPELAKGGDSPYGCVDMAGNVWEWTSSDYSKEKKVLRGGSWGYLPATVRAVYRNLNTPDYRYTDVGLRCAVEPGG